MDFNGKVAVVSGAGSGIGQQLTLQLLARGARVAAVDLRREGLKETEELAGAGERLSLHTLNVADRSAVEALPQGVLDAHGQIDIVINNAGVIQPFEKVQDLTLEMIQRMMDVNFYGTVYMTRAFLPHLLERPAAHIANVSSMGAFLPVPGQAIYGASKAAVKLMTEALFAELSDTSVGVSIVLPGAIDTNIAANSEVDLGLPDDATPEAGRALPADRAAEVILDGIGKGRLHIVVGSDAKLMYLASRVAPKGAIRLIQQQMKELLASGDDKA